MSEKETDILARTIYGEARGESISGMEAVASVVLNRVAFAKFAVIESLKMTGT